MNPPIPLEIVQGFMDQYDEAWRVEWEQIAIEDEDGSIDESGWAYLFRWSPNLFGLIEPPTLYLFPEYPCDRTSMAAFCCAVAARGLEHVEAQGEA